MRRPASFVALVLVVATLPLGGVSTIAQDAAPVTLPITPDPAACTVEPRPHAFFAQFVGTPASMPADEAMAEATPAPFVPPAGDPADAETVAAVTTTVVELIACFNAGDFLRASSLWTDAFVEGVAAEDPLPQEEFESFAATPVPLPADQRNAVLAIREVTELPDGRVGAFADFRYDDGSFGTQYAVFTREGDRWLVDEILYDALREATPTP